MHEITPDQFETLCKDVKELKDHLVGSLDRPGVLHDHEARIKGLESDIDAARGARNWAIGTIAAAIIASIWAWVSNNKGGN